MEQTEGEYAHMPTRPLRSQTFYNIQCIHTENHGHETYIEYCTNCLLNWNFYFMQWHEFVLLLNTYAYEIQSHLCAKLCRLNKANFQA